MLEIGGTEYVIDFTAIDKLLNEDKDLANREVSETEVKEILDANGILISTERITKTYEKGREVDMTRYETARILLEILLTFNAEIDDTLGLDRALSSAPLPFKLSFNTLLSYGIIKELD